MSEIKKHPNVILPEELQNKIKLIDLKQYNEIVWRELSNNEWVAFHINKVVCNSETLTIDEKTFNLKDFDEIVGKLKSGEVKAFDFYENGMLCQLLFRKTKE